MVSMLLTVGAVYSTSFVYEYNLTCLYYPFLFPDSLFFLAYREDKADFFWGGVLIKNIYIWEILIVIKEWEETSWIFNKKMCDWNKDVSGEYFFKKE